MARFILLTAPRSGSAWLVDLLNSHPEVTTYGELFQPEADELPAYGSRDVPTFKTYVSSREKGKSPKTKAGLLRRRISYVNALYSKRSDAAAVGFKLMYRQVSINPGLLPYLALRRTRIVHLIRTNVLDSVVSHETARARGVFHIHSGEPVAKVRVQLDADNLATRLDQHELSIANARSTLSRLRFPQLETFYEELTGPRGDAELARILDFLGVERGELVSSLVRANDAPHAELLTNYDEVRRALTGSRFEWMLR
jgi:LPS sulfotransferase NodH